MIELPWFSKELSPNSRMYWRKKNPIKAAYRDECYYIAKMCENRCVGCVKIAVKITFHPPDKRARDLDNCLASIKSGLDGVAMALEINDKNFRPITIDFGDVVKNGKIVIEFN